MHLVYFHLIIAMADNQTDTMKFKKPRERWAILLPSKQGAIRTALKTVSAVS
jgi:hypothetical protein